MRARNVRAGAWAALGGAAGDRAHHELDVGHVREVGLEVGTGGPVADKGEVRARQLAQHVAQHKEVLLRAEATHVDEERRVGVAAGHACPHLFAAEARVELVRVDAALPHVQAVALALVAAQLLLRAVRGHA